MLCSVLAGAKTLVEMAEWASDTARVQLAALGIGAPHATTIGRVLERLDADTLDRLAGAWAQARTCARAIAIDGKEARGVKNGGGTRVHLMAAIDHDTGAVLGQVDVGIKTNEISLFRPLLETIPALNGVAVTADALHTQTGHANYLAGRGAHYVLTVKGNQPTLNTQLQSLPWNKVRAGDRSLATANGREIIRTVKCVSVAAGIGFPNAEQAVQITRKSRPIGTRAWSTETVHAVTSLWPVPDPSGPRDISRIWVLEPEEAHYVEVPYRTMANPSVSLWEHKHALARPHERGIAQVDEAALFRTMTVSFAGHHRVMDSRTRVDEQEALAWVRAVLGDEWAAGAYWQGLLTGLGATAQTLYFRVFLNEDYKACEAPAIFSGPELEPASFSA